MSTVFIAISCVAVASIGAWIYAKCTSAERKAGREALERQLHEQERKESEARKRTREIERRNEIIEVLDWILRDPEVLKRRQYPDVHATSYAPALYDLLRNVKTLEGLSQRVLFNEQSHSANAKAHRQNREVLVEIQKALHMGQPVE